MFFYWGLILKYFNLKILLDKELNGAIEKYRSASKVNQKGSSLHQTRCINRTTKSNWKAHRTCDTNED